MLCSRKERGVTGAITALIVILVVVIGGLVAYIAITPGGVTTTTIVNTTTATSTVTSSTNIVSTSTAVPSWQLAPSADTVAAAQAEGGNLLIYVAFNQAAYTNISQVFMKVYPFAHIQVVGSLFAGNLYTRIAGEQAAGKYLVDIAGGCQSLMYPVLLANFTVPYANPELKDYPAGTTSPTNAWTPTFNVASVIEYNTELVTAANAPKSIADLANPAFKGMVTFNAPSGLEDDNALFTIPYQTMGNASWTTMMKAIAANNPVLTPTSSVAENNVATGQDAVGIATLSGAITAQRAGAPIGIVYTNPVPIDPCVEAIAKNAPHPAMAKLFLQWVASFSGQLTASQIFGLPSPLAAVNGAVNLPIPNTVTYASDPTLYSNPDHWKAAFHSIFGQ